MKTKLVCTALFVPAAIVSGYMSWTAWRAGAEGKWLFTAFTAFFLVLLCAIHLSNTRQREDAEPISQTTRFAGARVMPLYFLVFGGLLAAAVFIRFLYERAR
jgi:hypothetical protein